MNETLDWPRLFPLEPYRFHLGVRPADASQFFAPTPDHDRLMTERRRWLADATDEHCQLEPEGVPLLAEALDLARHWEASAATASTRAISCPDRDRTQNTTLSRSQNSDTTAPATVPIGTTYGQRCRELGLVWEPDFLLLEHGPDARFRLRGGVVCFPSGWSLADKLGRTVEAIHAVVPTLNSSLSGKIDAFLDRLAPGSAWGRSNWGLSQGWELNRHPRRALPALQSDTAIQDVFLRVEHQLFLRLPRTGGLLFGIRLSIHSLSAVLADPSAAAGLLRAVETMPESVAAYKGLAAIRSTLARWLSTSSG